MFFKKYFLGALFENGYPEYNGLVKNFELLIKITYGNVKIYIKNKWSKSKYGVKSKYGIISS